MTRYDVSLNNNFFRYIHALQVNTVLLSHSHLPNSLIIPLRNCFYITAFLLRNVLCFRATAVY